MINLSLAVTEFDQILRDPSKMPIDFHGGNPFIPWDRLMLETSEGMDKQDFTVAIESKEDETVRQAAGDLEIVRNLFDRQVEFSNIDLQRMPNNPHVLNNCGLSYLNKGDLKTAEELFAKAIEIKPDFFSARVHLAKVYLLQGNDDKALEIYHRLCEERPGDNQVLLNAAQIHLRRMELDQAATLLNEAVRHERVNLRVFNNLGVVCLLKYDFLGAIRWFRKALREDVRFIPAQSNLGVAYVLVQNYPKAERTFQAVLSLEKDNSGAVKNLANLYVGRGEYEKAAKLLEEYLDRRPSDVGAESLLSLCYLNLKEYTRSLRHLNLALKYARDRGIDETTLAKFRNNFGVIYRRSGNFERAKESYKEALSLTARPDKAIFHNLIALYLGRRSLEHARRTIEECLKVYPGDGLATLFLGQYYAQIGNYGLAVVLAKESANKLPKSRLPYLLWGTVLIEAFGDYEESIRVTQEGLTKEPSHRDLLNNLAYGYLMKGDVASARKVLDRVSGGDGNVFLTATRGLLLLKEGNIQEGSRLYNEAVNLARDPELKSLIVQKKYLESAKIALEDNRVKEGKDLVTDLFYRAVKYFPSGGFGNNRKVSNELTYGFEGV